MNKKLIADDAVYLNDGRFVEWERPSRIQRPDRICIPSCMWPDASTELVSYVGFDTMDEELRGYRLVASSAKYNAKMAIMGERWARCRKDEETTNKPEDFLLFAGSIAIYSIDQIPGTELNGDDFIRHGEIFTARKSNDILMSNQGLKNLVLEGLEEDSIKRVEAIIRGYENQELSEQDNRFKREHNAYRRGDFDRAEATFGTFGRWPSL
jgi:hypothetical protein